MSTQPSLSADGPRANPADGSIRHGDIRYVLIRADGLMGAFAGDNGAPLQLLADSIYRHGRLSLARYFNDNGGDIDATIKTMESRAPHMGWGLWKFARDGGSRLRLSIDNSPFATGKSARPQCAPAAGMFRAVAELVLGGSVHAQETDCMACGAPSCSFLATAGSG